MQNKTSSPSPICSSKAIVYLSVQLLTFVLNTFAALVLWRLKGYRRNISHLVVRVLVISDALGSLASVIPIIESCSGTKLRDSTLCTVFGYLSSVFLLWTALIVLFMCTLRYLALVRPLFYRTRLNYDIVWYILAGELIWSGAHLVLPLTGVGRFKFYSQGQYCAFEIKPTNAKDAALIHITVWEGWLTIAVLAFFSVRMLRELRMKQRRASRMSFQQRRGVQATSTRQQGYTLMTIAIVVIFMVCFIPFLVSWICYYYYCCCFNFF